MRKRIYKIIIITLLPILAVSTFLVLQHKRATNVRAFGHLTVDMGVPSGDPIFVVTNWLPGDCESRDIIMTNNDTLPIETAVRSYNESEINDLPDVLNIKITENSNVLYQQTVAQFFLDSDSLDGIPLSTLNPGDTKTYTFEVCFDVNAGNAYQNGQTIFDLIFGEVISPIQLPAECSHLKGIITQKIEGKNKKDRIRGTTANELILGYDGDDDLDGAGGMDCVVGGNGKDELDGGQDNDVVIGGEGNDDLDGGQGEDIIYGNNGNDEIKGGSSADTIYGGEGNDKIDSGSGNDTVYGENGNDELDGGAGTDYLNGGPGHDEIDGGPLTDTCVDGEDLDSCEL